MNQHMNEDIAWLRLQDFQREAENRRLLAGARRPAVTQTVRRLFARTARRLSRRLTVAG
jgi:hypothetical protein